MRRTLIAVTVGVLALAGCAPTPPPESTPTSTESGTPTPTPAIADDVLYELHATFAAADGAVVELVQTVYKPQPEAELEPGVTDALDETCPAWRDRFPPTAFVLSTFESALVSGTTWPEEYPIGISLGDAPTFSGEVTDFQAICGSKVLVVPGSGSAVTPIVGGWQDVRAGFGAVLSSSPTYEGPLPELQACTIVLSDEAAADPIAASWPTETTGPACVTGPDA